MAYTIEQLLKSARDPSEWADAEKMRAIRDKLETDEGFRNAVAQGDNVAGVPAETFLQSLSHAIKEVLPGESYPVMCPKPAKKPELECGKNGQVLKTFGNYCLAVEQDDYLNSRVRFNALSGRVMLFQMHWDLTPHPIRDNDLYHIRRHMSETYGLDKPDDIRQALAVMASKNAYHPVVNFLNSLKWDGRKRISDLFPKYLGAERSEYTTAVTKLLLYGAIQRAKNPGVKFDYCVILADTRQGTGKSSMCRFLALGDDWFCDALGDLSDSKKAYESIRGHWVCELSEMLATRRTKDIEAIKAYLSRTADDYRDPYGVYPERRPRQCVFIGTTNKPQFLPDDKTGNRRFIPILCDGSRAEKHPMEDEEATREFVRQCYAEAIVVGEKEGWPLVLDRKFEEQLNAIREQSTPEDTNVGAIQAWLDNTAEQVVCSRMIWDEAFPGRGEPSKYDLQDVSEIMCTQIVGWERYTSRAGNVAVKKFPKYGAQRAWKRVTSPVNSKVNDGFMELSEDDENMLPF